MKSSNVRLEISTYIDHESEATNEEIERKAKEIIEEALKHCKHWTNIDKAEVVHTTADHEYEEYLKSQFKIIDVVLNYGGEMK